jgi:hypothetical protein
LPIIMPNMVRALRKRFPVNVAVAILTLSIRSTALPQTMNRSVLNP